MAEAQKTSQPAHSLFTITQEEEEAYPHSHHQPY